MAAPRTPQLVFQLSAIISDIPVGLNLEEVLRERGYAPGTYYVLPANHEDYSPGDPPGVVVEVRP